MSGRCGGGFHGETPRLFSEGDGPPLLLHLRADGLDWREEGRPEPGTPEMQMRAARAFARCINAREEEPLFDLLAPDVTFRKQRLPGSFSYRGRTEVIDFIKQANENAHDRLQLTYPRYLTAEIGRTAPPYPETTGVIGTRNGHRCTFWSFLFDRSGRVKRIWSRRHIPDPNKAVGLGERPGLDEGDLLESKKRWLNRCRRWVWKASTQPIHPLIFWTFGSSPEQLAGVHDLYMIDLPVLFPGAQLRGQVIPVRVEIANTPRAHTEPPWHLYSKMGLHSFPAVAVQLGPVILRYGLGPYQPDNVYQELAELGLPPDVEV